MSFFIFLPHLNTSSHTKVCFILVEPYLVFWNGIAFQLIIIYSKYFVFTVAYLPSWKNFPLCSYWNHSIIRIKFCPFLLEPFKFTKYCMLCFHSSWKKEKLPNMPVLFFWQQTALFLCLLNLYLVPCSVQSMRHKQLWWHSWDQDMIPGTVSWKAGVGFTWSIHLLVKWHFDCFVNSVNVEKTVDSQFSFSAWNVGKELLIKILHVILCNIQCSQ